jgi:hypothetical protein
MYGLHCKGYQGHETGAVWPGALFNPAQALASRAARYQSRCGPLKPSVEPLSLKHLTLTRWMSELEGLRSDQSRESGHACYSGFSLSRVEAVLICRVRDRGCEAYTALGGKSRSIVGAARGPGEAFLMTILTRAG